jgi:transposase
MKGFVQGVDRQQTTLLPECLDDWVGESNPIRAVDVFVDALELRDLGFDGVDPAATGRPAYHPSPMLKHDLVLHIEQIGGMGPTRR